jgi:hypothetical protein
MMRNYAEVRGDRREYLLNYFGEKDQQRRLRASFAQANRLESPNRLSVFIRRLKLAVNH